MDLLTGAAMLCLALNVYHEARGEPWQGQIAVAQVQLRRADFDGDNVCRVTYAPKQFSWTGMPTLPKPRHDDPRWIKAKAAAQYAALWAVFEMGEDYSRGATLYHNCHVRPYWSRAEMVRHVGNIGCHKFYVERR